MLFLLRHFMPAAVLLLARAVVMVLGTLVSVAAVLAGMLMAILGGVCLVVWMFSHRPLDLAHCVGFFAEAGGAALVVMTVQACRALLERLANAQTARRARLRRIGGLRLAHLPMQTSR